jgi:ABC-type sulfate/molybdate transport systems ATPase subunit
MLHVLTMYCTFQSLMRLCCTCVNELQLKAGEALTVLAFAGAGKTACLRAFALARPSDK